MNYKNFRNMLVILAAHAATKDVRYYLCGVHLKQIDAETLHATATDGHQLARVTVKESFFPVGEEHIVKLHSIKRLPKLTRTDISQGRDEAMVNLAVSDLGGSSALVLTIPEFPAFGNVCLELIDGRFPDADRVIPEQTDTGDAISLNPEYIKKGGEFFAALSMIARVSTGKLEFSAIHRSADLKAVRWDGLHFNDSFVENALYVVMPHRHNEMDSLAVKLHFSRKSNAFNEKNSVQLYQRARRK